MSCMVGSGTLSKEDSLSRSFRSFLGSGLALMRSTSLVMWIFCLGCLCDAGI